MSAPVSPVHVGRALESLRNSNFDTVSAMGEVIDNSLEADAKNIKIEVQKIEKRNTLDLTEIAFADDGNGMDLDTLHRCLQLGFSVRYNDRRGIGRFGVGMTLGAITQCTRIEVFSKTHGGEWNFTYLDLEEFKNQDNPIIPTPVHKSIPKQYDNMMSDNGTLVIWKNLDREDAQINDMIKWISRTYRKFIGNKIISNSKTIKNPDQRHIFLDGKELSAFDPLYAIETEYNSEVSDLGVDLEIPFQIHPYDAPPTKRHGSSTITIRMSLLPESWRQIRGRANNPENRKRRIQQAASFSILRNNREVSFGKIPYYKMNQGQDRELDRFWGCEISFNAELDHWFSVKNIKVGARPLPELREEIQRIVNPSIYSYREIIKKTWDANEPKKSDDDPFPLPGTGNNSNDNGDSSTQDTDDINELLDRSGEIAEADKNRLREILKKSPIAFNPSYSMGATGLFVDIVSAGGLSIVNLNMENPFWKKFFDSNSKLKEQIEKHDTNDTSFNRFTDFVYLAMGTFATAKKEFDPDQTQTADEFFKRLMYNWTFYLNDVISKIPND